MQIIIDTAVLATPFKAVGRGISKAYNKAAQIKLDMDARAVLRRAKRETAVQIRAMELEPNTFGELLTAAVAATEPKAPKKAPNRGTSRLKPAVQPRRAKR